MPQAPDAKQKTGQPGHAAIRTQRRADALDLVGGDGHADAGGTDQDKKLKMWYDKPATNWNEALPLGNGRIAAMVFGDPAKEKLQLNEGTFWSGGPSRNDNPLALKALDSIRYLIFKEDYRRANTLSNQYLTAKQLHGSKFQVVGNLNLIFAGNTTGNWIWEELSLLLLLK